MKIKASKIILSSLNVLFLLGAIGIIANCMTIRKDKETDPNKKENIKKLAASCSAALIIGGFIALVSLIGFIGALVESTILLVIYVIIVGTFMIAQLAIILVGIAVRSTLDKGFDYIFNKMKQGASVKNPTAISFLREIQTIFKCCGVDSPNEWSAKERKEECPLRQGSCRQIFKAFVEDNFNFIVPASVVIFLIESFAISSALRIIVLSNRKKSD